MYGKDAVLILAGQDTSVGFAEKVCVRHHDVEVEVVPSLQQLMMRRCIKKNDTMMMMTTMRMVSFLLLAVSVVYIGSSDGGYCCEAFSPITSRHFSSSRLQLHAEQQPNNALLSDLKALQSEEGSKQVVSSSDYFVADAYNVDETASAAVEELKNINNSGGEKLMAASAEITPPKKKLIPKPPPLVFDPLNPKAMVAIVKSFIATDFGIQTTSKVRNNQHTSLMMEL